MLSGLFRGSQSVAVGGPIGSLKDAKTMSSNRNFDAAYLASRLGATKTSKLPLDFELTDRYKGDVVDSMGTAEKMVYLQNAVKGYESEAEECLKKEFKEWLAGAHADNQEPQPYKNAPGRLERRNARGELMDDWHPTWWGKRQLTHLNGVKEYLRKDYEEADKENFKMNMLAQFGPQNLDEAWAYFKYWVKRHPVGPEKCLSERGASDFIPPTTFMPPAEIENITMREPLTLSKEQLKAYHALDDGLLDARLPRSPWDMDEDRSNLIKLAVRLATIPRNVDSDNIKAARSDPIMKKVYDDYISSDEYKADKKAQAVNEKDRKTDAFYNKIDKDRWRKLEKLYKFPGDKVDGNEFHIRKWFDKYEKWLDSKVESKVEGEDEGEGEDEDEDGGGGGEDKGEDEGGEEGEEGEESEEPSQPPPLPPPASPSSSSPKGEGSADPWATFDAELEEAQAEAKAMASAAGSATTPGSTTPMPTRAQAQAVFEAEIAKAKAKNIDANARMAAERAAARTPTAAKVAAARENVKAAQAEKAEAKEKARAVGVNTRAAVRMASAALGDAEAVTKELYEAEVALQEAKTKAAGQVTAETKAAEARMEAASKAAAAVEAAAEAAAEEVAAEDKPFDDVKEAWARLASLEEKHGEEARVEAEKKLAQEWDLQAFDNVDIEEFKTLEDKIKEMSEVMRHLHAKATEAKKKLDKKAEDSEKEVKEPSEEDKIQIAQWKKDYTRARDSFFKAKGMKDELLLTKSRIMDEGYIRMKFTLYHLKMAGEDEEAREAYDRLTQQVEDFDFDFEYVLRTKMERLERRRKNLITSMPDGWREQSSRFNDEITDLKMQLQAIDRAKKPKKETPFTNNPKYVSKPLPKRTQEEIDQEIDQRRQEKQTEQDALKSRRETSLEISANSIMRPIRGGEKGAPPRPTKADPWIKAKDDKSGKTYYYKERSLKMQWDRPDDFGSDDDEGDAGSSSADAVAPPRRSARVLPSDQVSIEEYARRNRNLNEAKKRAPPDVKFMFETKHGPQDVTDEAIREIRRGKNYNTIVDDMVKDLGQTIFSTHTVKLPHREAYKTGLIAKVGPKDIDELMQRFRKLTDNTTDVVDVRPMKMIYEDRHYFNEFMKTIDQQDQASLIKNPGRMRDEVNIYIDGLPGFTTPSEAENIRLRVLRHSYYSREPSGARWERWM